MSAGGTGSDTACAVSARERMRHALCGGVESCAL